MIKPIYYTQPKGGIKSTICCSSCSFFLAFFVELEPQRNNPSYRIEKVAIHKDISLLNLYAQLVVCRNNHRFIAKKKIHKYV